MKHEDEQAFVLHRSKAKTCEVFEGGYGPLLTLLTLMRTRSSQHFLHNYWMRLNWTFKARIELFCFSCIQFRKEPPTRRKKLDNPDQAFLILGKNGSKYVQID